MLYWTVLYGELTVQSFTVVDLFVCFHRAELSLGHSKRPAALKAMLSVLEGERGSVRGRLPVSGLSVEQQVAALIDQATDPNILGRTWAGWEPWVWISGNPDGCELVATLMGVK